MIKQPVSGGLGTKVLSVWIRLSQRTETMVKDIGTGQVSKAVRRTKEGNLLKEPSVPPLKGLQPEAQVSLRTFDSGFSMQPKKAIVLLNRRYKLGSLLVRPRPS